MEGRFAFDIFHKLSDVIWVKNALMLQTDWLKDKLSRQKTINLEFGAFQYVGFNMVLTCCPIATSYAKHGRDKYPTLPGPTS